MELVSGVSGWHIFVIIYMFAVIQVFDVMFSSDIRDHA